MRIRDSIRNLKTAMSNAGYTASQYTIVVQDYVSPMPTSGGMRYPEVGFSRQFTGGCGFFNQDVNWANNTALKTINDTVREAVVGVGLPNVKFLELRAAFNGRRLCENTVRLLEEIPLNAFTSLGASDRTEWIQQIRTASAAFNSPYYTQESLHPNFWGQMALRNCVRQVFNSGQPRGGTCTHGDGRNTRGEPNMTLGN